ncbi:hypothetical protein [Streptomyces sp. RPT161]|uniref:hypothetical protein n=1 Tax=Streptomyces sp. RPT161 TaxID=3015993 RepID=UPI0022B9190D|nr:hypothetical protein [Streptomyces sp. RPT161]
MARRSRAPHDEEFDKILQQAIDTDPTMRWACGHGRYVMAAGTARQCTAEQGADAHGHSGAQRLALALIYDWLDDTLT